MEASLQAYVAVAVADVSQQVTHGCCYAESMSWQRCQNGSTTPPALAAHTLTAVGQHGILCFGGHGKKVYNTVHKLDHTTCLWQQFKTIGVGDHHSCRDCLHRCTLTGPVQLKALFWLCFSTVH